MTLALLNCQHCGKHFLPNKPWQKYCGQFCNKAAYYARRLPPSPLDDPQTGPTPVQDAENERRKALKTEPPMPPDPGEALGGLKPNEDAIRNWLKGDVG